MVIKRAQPALAGFDEHGHAIGPGQGNFPDWQQAVDKLILTREVRQALSTRHGRGRIGEQVAGHVFGVGTVTVGDFLARGGAEVAQPAPKIGDLVRGLVVKLHHAQVLHGGQPVPGQHLRHGHGQRGGGQRRRGHGFVSDGRPQQVGH
jgi:hypothetical protein